MRVPAERAGAGVNAEGRRGPLTSRPLPGRCWVTGRYVDSAPLGHQLAGRVAVTRRVVPVGIDAPWPPAHGRGIIPGGVDRVAGSIG